MKVAQFIDTYDVGGAETMMFRLTQQLIAKGVDVTILHFGNSYLVEMCEAAGVPHMEVPNKHLYRSIIKVHLFSFKFAAFLKRNEFNVLHTHLYGPVSGTFFATQLFGIRHIATLHDVYMVQQRFGRGLLLSLASLCGVKLVAVSNDMAEFYCNYLPIKRDVRTIYNGIEINARSIDSSDNSEFTLTLICVGRLVALKQTTQLVSNLAAFLKQRNICLWLVGDGSERASIENLIEKENLGKHVRLLGQRNDVDELLAQADVFLLNSSTEGLSCSIIEAMAQGLPCVVTDVGGNRELVQTGVNGFLYADGDYEKLISSLEQLLQQPELRLGMSRKSSERAKQLFTVEAMAQHYINEYLG